MGCGNMGFKRKGRKMCKATLKDTGDGILGSVVQGLALYMLKKDIGAYANPPYFYVSSSASYKEAENLHCVYIVIRDTGAMPPDIPAVMVNDIIKLANKYIDLATERVTEKLVKLVKE